MVELTRNIAHRLREARSQAGFKSAKAYANDKQVAYITYSQHESGKRAINCEMLIQYCKDFKVTPNWLLTGDDHFANDQHRLSSDELSALHRVQAPRFIHSDNFHAAQAIDSYRHYIQAKLEQMQLNMTHKEQQQIVDTIYQKLYPIICASDELKQKIIDSIIQLIDSYPLKRSIAA